MNHKKLLALLFSSIFMSACGTAPTNNGPANVSAGNTGTATAPQTLTVV